MEHTAQYQLNKWSETDRILMEDFNADNDKLEQALDSCAKIATGTYRGTYAFGEENPNTLTFNFVPKIVIISAATMTDANNCTPLVGINGTVCTYRGGSMYGEAVKTTWTFSDKTVSWYSSTVDLQMNNNTTYRYIAIG